MYEANSKRKLVVDSVFIENEISKDYSNHIFQRLTAVRKRFDRVDFRYAVFDGGYLRDCHFDSCDFTGAKFISSNFHGTKFCGCRFEYAVFERTNIGIEILDTESPRYENLKMRFARTLRLNYQQLGDVKGVNKAMELELEAWCIHLRKALTSDEEYYRKKYHGYLWFKTLIEYMYFIFGNFVWGNGESAKKLLRAVFLILIGMSFYDVFMFEDPSLLESYKKGIGRAAAAFMGIPIDAAYPKPYLAGVTFVRLVAVGFLLSIIIKKYNRR